MNTALLLVPFFHRGEAPSSSLSAWPYVNIKSLCYELVELCKVSLWLTKKKTTHTFALTVAKMVHTHIYIHYFILYLRQSSFNPHFLLLSASHLHQLSHSQICVLKPHVVLLFLSLFRNSVMFNNELMADVHFVVGQPGRTQRLPGHRVRISSSSRLKAARMKWTNKLSQPVLFILDQHKNNLFHRRQ